MRHYCNIDFPQTSGILMRIAQGFSDAVGSRYIISDMVHTLGELYRYINSNNEQPFYIAIIDAGTEGGVKEECIERCKALGYPLVIAKISKASPFDWDLVIMLTHNWMNGDNNYMEQEFNSL